MTDEKETLEKTAAEDMPPEEEKEKGILTVFRFIMVPVVIVGIVVFIIVIFGQMALKEKSVRDYLYDIRTGSQSERWQAAYQLSNMLANPKKDYEADARKELAEIMLIFAETKDPKIREYLALAMGRLKDPRAVPALQKSLSDDDSQTVIWSLWALGNLGDTGSVPLILEKLESQDSGIRIMSAYVLGAIADARAIPPLQGHLEDSASEVAWNAALSLARMKDASGSGILLKLMDRSYLGGFPQMPEQNKQDMMLNAIVASTKLDDPQLQDQIRKLSTSDPSPAVRDAALKALK
jgi:HEAT repeat protein